MSTKPQQRESCVLELDATDANKFFQKPESYCTIELPPYFNFGPVLGKVKNFSLNNLILNPYKK